MSSKILSTPKSFLTVGCLLIVIGAGLGIAWTVHHSSPTHPASSKTSTANQNTKGELPNTVSNTAGNTAGVTINSAQPGDQKNNSSGSTGSTLLAPTGDFISTHHASSSSYLASVCNTSVGATCVINFSLNSQIKSLQAEVTDRGGASYWNSWTPASIGLTPGTWKVEAVATLGGETKSTVDSMPLVVSP